MRDLSLKSALFITGHQTEFETVGMKTIYVMIHIITPKKMK